jgi:hypothetical protein
MDQVVNVTEVELNSSCVCEYYDEFDQLQISDDCFGCFDDSLVDLEDLILLPWLKNQKADNGDYIVASGSNVGWQRLSGEVSFEIDYDDIRDDLVHWFSLNGEFRLTFKLADGEFTVRRGSHDEPMGAYFDLRIVKSDRVEEVI